MKYYSLLFFVALSLLAFLPQVSNAGTIEVMYGDMDNFGIGDALSSDGSFNYRDVISSGDEGVTDFFTYASSLPLEWSFAYNLPMDVIITKAYLEIVSGGQGQNGPSKVWYQDHYIGELTDGEINGKNYLKKDVLNIDPVFFPDFDGGELFKVITAPTVNDGFDNWVLDYSKLTIKYETNKIPTPEPKTILMLGLGICFFLIRFRNYYV